jgi:hypothetical protein
MTCVVSPCGDPILIGHPGSVRVSCTTSVTICTATQNKQRGRLPFKRRPARPEAQRSACSALPCAAFVVDDRRENMVMLNASEIDALLEGPALAPPNGTIPNFYDFSDKSTSNVYWAVLLISFIVSTLGVWGRCYVKACIIKGLHLDDCEFDTRNLGSLLIRYIILRLRQIS